MINIEPIQSKKINADNISFLGHNLSQNSNGEKVYKFFLPKISFDNAQVVLKRLKLDENGNINLRDHGTEQIFDMNPGETSIEIKPKDIGLRANEVLAYKFIIDGKEYTDKHKGVNIQDSYYNLADLLTNDVFETPKSIYHILPNSFNPKLSRRNLKSASGEFVESNDATARTNHFLQLDSDFNGIIQKIPYIKQLGFRSILSAPIFGQDNISNASYWTNNPYQITERFGTMEDYKKLQIELFKNSMTFIADGAFSSEGLQGIHYRDVLRHGDNSPFKNWFTLDGFQRLGVLPDSEKAFKNFDIKIVNSPVIWSVDKDGLPTTDFGSKNRYYNPAKETFIQLYDRRLTSEDQLLKDEVFTKYDIKNTTNPDDISDSSDSVFPYSFPVNPEFIAQKAKMAKAQPKREAKSSLLFWDTFALVKAKESAGASLWDGNKDIVKLQYTMPAYMKQAISDDGINYEHTREKFAQISSDVQDVQDYIIGIGQFWTNKTAKILREYIASQISTATSTDEIKNILDAKAGSALPATVKYITKQQIYNVLSSDSPVNRRLQVPLTLQQALKEYPLEALEVSDDLTSILSYPSLKEKMDERLYKKVMNNLAGKILKALSASDLPCGNLLDADGNISSDNNLVVQLISDDITRFLLVKGLDSEIPVEDIFFNNTKKLKQITASKICRHESTPEGKEKILLSVLEDNMSKISDRDIQEIVTLLKGKIANITNDKLKVANLIIDKTEAGLNWRIDAAKDIADKDNHKEGRASTKDTWEFSKAFWERFNDGVRLYNSHSYRIGEYTDTSLPTDTKTAMFPTSGILEDKSIEQGGFTTQSNYNYMYATFLRFFTALPERYGYQNQNVLDLICNKFDRGWDDMPGYLFSGSKNNIVYSHSAVGNHDKQRIATTFSMNVVLAYLNENEFVQKYASDEYWQNVAREIHKDLSVSSLEYSKFYNDINAGNFKNVFAKLSARNLAKMAGYTNAFAVATKDNPNHIEIMRTITAALDTLAAKSHPYQNTFFYKNFEDTYKDIINNICEDNVVLGDIKKLQAKVHEVLTEPVIKRNIELAKLMVALPCNPTLYAGDELLETGGEEKAKNVSIQNRGRLHWEYLENAEYKHINAFKDELAQIYNLRNDEGLTSLVNGDTILLKKQGGDDNRGVIGMYRYNDKDDSIILLHNSGLNSSRNFEQDALTISLVDLSS